jgi:hypothetical protein
VLILSSQLFSAATFTGAPFSALVQANDDCNFNLSGNFKDTSGPVKFEIRLKRKKANINDKVFGPITFDVAGQQVTYTNTPQTEGVYAGTYVLSPPDYLAGASYYAEIKCYMNGLHFHTISTPAPVSSTWLPFPGASNGNN